MGKRMVSLVNSHTDATSKRWHLWEIDSRFGLNSTPGWSERQVSRVLGEVGTFTPTIRIQFLEDVVYVWQQMPTQWLQERHPGAAFAAPSRRPVSVMPLSLPHW